MTLIQHIQVQLKSVQSPERSPVQVVVGVRKDVELWHPETEERPEQNRSRQHEVEVLPDQTASQQPGQQVCYKRQSSVQEPQDELPRLYQLCRHSVQLLHVDDCCEASWGVFSLQIHVFLLADRFSHRLNCSTLPFFWLCAQLQLSVTFSCLWKALHSLCGTLLLYHCQTCRRAHGL